MAEWDKQKVLAIGGPTASGKTSLSIQLAKKLDGEIICADSMQIYKELDVGTAKVTKEEMQGVPHHMVGFLSPAQKFSVADFVEMAKSCIEEIASRGKLPIVVGGTGLYIESLLKGIQFSEQKTDETLRVALQKQAEEFGPIEMHHRLQQIDPEYAKEVHPNNVGRVLRAIELFQSTGITMTQQRANSLPKQKPYNSLLFCIGFENRKTLYERIDLRVDQMMQQGLLQEAELVYKNRETYKTAAQAIGYKEFFPYFQGEQSVEQCAEVLKQASRNYAKRQLTWFRRMEDVFWLDAEKQDLLRCALSVVEKTWSLESECEKRE